MDVDSEFIRARTARVSLGDGGTIEVRPIVPGDKDDMLAGFDLLSPESRYLRFFATKERLTERELRYLTEVDYHDHFAWVAHDVGDPGHQGVGVARYVRLPGDPTTAEPAAVVIDGYQGRGIGAILVRLLAESAVANGIRSFRAYVLSDNVGIVDRLSDAVITPDSNSATIRVDVPLPFDASAFGDSSLNELLRATAAGDVEMQRVGMTETWDEAVSERRERMP
jgi:GNAT superfamily N-acetyltransferase